MTVGLDFTEAANEADEVLSKLMARISPVGESNKYRKVLIYGDPGTGKTVFTASAPSPLIVDVERGTSSITNHPELSNAAVLEFRSVAQLELLIAKLGEGALPEYQTIVIDSFSELQKRDLDDILGAAAKSDASRNKYLPTGPDYNVNTEHMRRVAASLRDLNRHVIVTCHVKEEKDDSTGRLLVRPNLTPKLAGTLAGMFDVVGYMSITGQGESAVRTLQVHPTVKVTAKTRVGGLLPVIENPTFTSLFKDAK